MKQFNVTDFLITHYSTLDSTQDELKRLIDSGSANDKMIITSAIQTGGRGRYERKWTTNKGNIALSICLKDEFESPQLLCYVAAMSLHELLMEIGVDDAKLKWVNDILVNDKKISGILLERYKGFIIVGIGCNIVEFDEMDLLNATSLESLGININCTDLMIDLIKKLSINIKHYKDYGFIKFKNYWLENAYKLGEPIEVNIASSKQVGIFKTIDNEGKLVLENKGICHSISAGELFDL